MLLKVERLKRREFIFLAEEDMSKNSKMNKRREQRIKNRGHIKRTKLKHLLGLEVSKKKNSKSTTSLSEIKTGSNTFPFTCHAGKM